MIDSFYVVASHQGKGRVSKMESALLYDAIAILIHQLDGDQRAHPWVVGGSTGLMMRGLALEPRDIDIYCDLSSMNYLCDRLKAYMVEAPHYSETNMYTSTIARFDIAGVPIELVANFTVRSASSSYHIEVQQLLSPYKDVMTAPWMQNVEGLPLVPLAHELLFNFLRKREDRLEQIVTIFKRQYSIHLPAFSALIGANILSDMDKVHLHRMIAM